MDKAEAEAESQSDCRSAGLGRNLPISAASQQGVKELCWDVMTFIIENPIVQAESRSRRVRVMSDGSSPSAAEEAEPKQR